MPADWTWTLLDVVGVIVLGGLIAYGIIMSSRRRQDRGTERRRDEATKRLYDDDVPDERPPAP